MTRIDHLGAFIDQGGASGLDPGAPLLFWDGYGLGNLYSGIGRHARRLADALRHQGTQPILVGSDASCRLFDDLPYVGRAHSGSFARLRELKVVWPQLTGAYLEKALQGYSSASPRAILHGLSNFNIPVWPRKTSFIRVLTVHDIIPLLDPGSVSRSYYLQLSCILGRALALADSVVCVSNWTRKTLLERYPKAESKIRVIRNGFDGFGPGPSRDSQVQRGSRPQLMCVSRYEKYKRLELIVDILGALPSEWQGVVVTDKRGERALRAAVACLGRDVSLMIMTDVSDLALKQLYQSSQVYIHPSLFEGFCLPVAEALVAGIPVVFQKGSATEELVGDNVGFGLEMKSTPLDWAHAALAVYDAQRAPNWSEAMGAHLKILPTWEVAAQSLKNLYNELS